MNSIVLNICSSGLIQMEKSGFSDDTCSLIQNCVLLNLGKKFKHEIKQDAVMPLG